MKTHTHQVIQYGIIFIFCIGASVKIGQDFPLFLLMAIAAGIYSFIRGKSTKVPLRQGMTRLSYREFDAWARRNHRIMSDQALFSRTDMHWSEKLSIISVESYAARHCKEPSQGMSRLAFVAVLLGLFIFVPSIRDAYYSIGPDRIPFIQLVWGLGIGLAAGNATGGFIDGCAVLSGFDLSICFLDD